MANIELMGGEVQLYLRGDGKNWHCSTSVGGRQHRTSTKLNDLDHAQVFAEEWYLVLKGKYKAGILDVGRTFKKAADQFLREYGVITEGERSEKWTQGHAIRLRLRLVPFFGDLVLDKVSPGRVQEYRVHRMTSYKDANPHSKSQHRPKERLPARSTIHSDKSASNRFNRLFSFSNSFNRRA